MKKIVILVIAGVVSIGGGIWIYKSRATVQTSHTIKIGAVLPLTGPGSEFAQYIKEGIEFAKKDLQEDNSPILPEVVFVDSKNQPSYAVSAYNKLISTVHPPVVIVALSSVARALAPLANDTKVVQIGIAVAIPGITKESKYVFRIYPEAHGMAGIMAKFDAERLSCKKAAVLYINDDFGRASADVFREVFSSYGGRVVLEESYELLQKDFRILALKVKEKNPECVYIGGYGPAYGSLIRQLLEMGFMGIITADMTLGLPTTLRQVQGVLQHAYFVDGEMDIAFIKRYKQYYGHLPTSYAGYAYDQIKLVVSAAEQLIADGKPLSADNMANEILKIKNFPGVMGPITILPDGESSLRFVVKEIKGDSISVVFRP